MLELLAVGVTLGVLDGVAPTLSEGVGEAVCVGVAEGEGVAEATKVPPVHEKLVEVPFPVDSQEGGLKLVAFALHSASV